MTPSAVATFVVGLVLGWLLHVMWARRATARAVYAALAGRSGGPVVQWTVGWRRAIKGAGFQLMLCFGACLFVGVLAGLGYFLIYEQHDVVGGWLCLLGSPVSWLSGCALHVAALGLEDSS